MSYKTRTARRRLRCEHCKKPIELGQKFFLIEKVDEFGLVKIRYHEDCKTSGAMTYRAAKLFGEAA